MTAPLFRQFLVVFQYSRRRLAGLRDAGIPHNPIARTATHAAKALFSSQMSVLSEESFLMCRPPDRCDLYCTDSLRPRGPCLSFYSEVPFARTSYRTPVPTVSASRRWVRLRKLHEIGGGRKEDYVSKHFERWKELASLTSKEQDPARLTELAHEINLVLTQRTPYLDPPLREPLE